MSLLSRRTLRAVGLVAVAAVAYAGGVLTGVVGSRQPAPDESSASVIEEAADRIQANAARPVDRDVLERAAVEGMLKALGDRWSSYYEPAEFASFKDSLEGRYAGVGLWVRQGFDGRLLVASVQTSSPADTAGILAGDEIVSVDGEAVGGDSVASVVSQLRGDDGTTVRIALRRADGDEVVTLTRADVASEDVTTERLGDGVIAISIEAFTRGVGREVRASLERESPDAVVLDLRGNPGGLLDEAVEAASVFLDGGPVVSYERRDQATTTLDALGDGDVTTPLVVLVDGKTASAAEVLAGALQDRNRAVVVGSQTYGKGSVQEPASLSDGSALELTVGRFLLPSGRVVDEVGIEPDVLISVTAPEGAAEDRALEILTGLSASLTSTGRG